jgi:hypothetical protein
MACQVNYMKNMRKYPILLTAAVALTGFASPAYAYLDPSTGSMVISAVLGVLATEIGRAHV